MKFPFNGDNLLVYQFMLFGLIFNYLNSFFKIHDVEK